MQVNNTINNHHDIRIAGKKGFYSNIIKRMFTDIDYLYLIGKIFKIKVLKQKTPLFAIIDINNVCNLHCKHCYWWLTRDGEKKELTSDDWKKVIKKKIKKNHILQTNIVGGEPLLRTDILEVFNEELPGKFTIITNGTFELVPYSGLISYWISIDGTKETHDKITVNIGGKIPGTLNSMLQELKLYTKSKSKIQHISTKYLGVLRIFSKLKIIPVTNWQLLVMYKDLYYDDKLLLSTGYKYKHKPIDALKDMADYYKSHLM